MGYADGYAHGPYKRMRPDPDLLPPPLAPVDPYLYAPMPPLFPCVRLRGLPFDVKVDDIRIFLVGCV